MTSQDLAAARLLLARRQAVRKPGLVPRPDGVSHPRPGGRLQGVSRRGDPGLAELPGLHTFARRLRAHRQRQQDAVARRAARSRSAGPRPGGDRACHRGSVPGIVPGPARSPRRRRSRPRCGMRCATLRPGAPGLRRGASRKIGNPAPAEALIPHTREHGSACASKCPDAGRLELLLEDYAFLVDDPEWLCRLLKALILCAAARRLRGWRAQARGRGAGLFTALMHEHYDPGYLRSMANFAGFGARVPSCPDPRPEATGAAAALIERDEPCRRRPVHARRPIRPPVHRPPSSFDATLGSYRRHPRWTVRYAWARPPASRAARARRRRHGARDRATRRRRPLVVGGVHGSRPTLAPRGRRPRRPLRTDHRGRRRGCASSCPRGHALEHAGSWSATPTTT